MAYVFFGQIVMRQIQGLKPVAAQMRCNLGALAQAAGGQAHKHMGFGGIADAVVELGDGTRRFAAPKGGQVAQQTAKPLETAPFLGDGHR